MTVALNDAGAVALSDVCGPDDAEALLSLLLAHPGAAVDWRACEGAHTAVIQVLLAGRPALAGPPRDAFLAQWVEPLLSAR